MEKVYTGKEVAEILQISRGTFWKIMKSENPIPAIRFGREYRVFESDLKAWMKKQEYGRN